MDGQVQKSFFQVIQNYAQFTLHHGGFTVNSQQVSSRPGILPGMVGAGVEGFNESGQGQAPGGPQSYPTLNGTALRWEVDGTGKPIKFSVIFSPGSAQSIPMPWAPSYNGQYNNVSQAFGSLGFFMLQVP